LLLCSSRGRGASRSGAACRLRLPAAFAIQGAGPGRGRGWRRRAVFSTAVAPASGAAVRFARRQPFDAAGLWAARGSQSLGNTFTCLAVSRTCMCMCVFTSIWARSLLVIHSRANNILHTQTHAHNPSIVGRRSEQQQAVTISISTHSTFTCQQHYIYTHLHACACVRARAHTHIREIDIVTACCCSLRLPKNPETTKENLTCLRAGGSTDAQDEDDLRLRTIFWQHPGQGHQAPQL
jgi:hypothetical protein